MYQEVSDLYHICSYSTLDGEVFGQRRDQAELLDGTIITLSQEQLRKVGQ